MLNVANKFSKFYILIFSTSPSTRVLTLDGLLWLGLGTNAWIRRFQDGGCSTLYSTISTQIASSSSARGFFYSVDIFIYIFSYVPGDKDALRAKNSLEFHVM